MQGVIFANNTSPSAKCVKPFRISPSVRTSNESNAGFDPLNAAMRTNETGIESSSVVGCRGLISAISASCGFAHFWGSPGLILIIGNRLDVLLDGGGEAWRLFFRNEFFFVLIFRQCFVRLFECLKAVSIRRLAKQQVNEEI